jgi:hypothetical protein
MPPVRVPILLLACLIAWSAMAPRAGAQAQAPAGKAAAKPPAKAKKNPLLKLVEPWPSPEKLKQRREEAEGNALFAQTDVLAVTLVGDFKAINKDRDPNSKQRYPGALRLEGGAELPVQFRARGHVRRMARTCDYVPLLVEFEKKTGAGTLFARQEALKLVVQCAGGGEFEQYVLREYLAYRIYNLITRQSFRARLARVTYVDKASGKPAGTRLGMFLEDETDVAHRLEGRVVELPRLMFDDLDSDALMPAMIFEYFVGNTDVSIYALHNVRIVQRPDKTLHVIPYDFDLSGLVNAPYAVPSRGFMIKSVTERVYRGPCRRPELVDPYIANFVAKRDEIRALPDAIPGFSRESRSQTRDYIDSFYSSIRSAKDVKSLFVSCAAKPTM